MSCRQGIQDFRLGPFQSMEVGDLVGDLGLIGGGCLDRGWGDWFLHAGLRRLDSSKPRAKPVGKILLVPLSELLSEGQRDGEKNGACVGSLIEPGGTVLLFLQWRYRPVGQKEKKGGVLVLRQST